MTKLRFTFNALASLLFVIVLCAAAQAQTRQRTFVSAAGNDANDCSELTPCRNWQPAIDKTITGGEVVALDSTGFGPINLTRSMTITGEGVHAVARAATTPGSVAVFISGPTNQPVAVNLRHLYVQNNTAGTGSFGIRARNFSALHIENVTVNGFTSVGIRCDPDTAGAHEMFIKDSISRNNANGIILNTSNGATLTATVERTRAENNSVIGFEINAGSVVGATKVAVRKSLASGNANDGFRVQNGAEVNIEESVSSNNGNDGINVRASSTVRVSNSTVTSNTGQGFDNSGGTFQSRSAMNNMAAPGTNTVTGNTGGNTAGAITYFNGQ